MSDFKRFSEQVTSTSGKTLTDAELDRIYYGPYVRPSSGKTPQQIQQLRRKFQRKMERRAFRERIARLIFRF